MFASDFGRLPLFVVDLQWPSDKADLVVALDLTSWRVVAGLGEWTSRFVRELVVLDSSRAVNGRPEFCELKPWIFHDAHAPNFA